MTLLAYYENFSFDNPFIAFPVIIWGLAAGFIIAAILSYYNKIYLGYIVRALVKNQASSPEAALTFAEAGIKSSISRRHAVFSETVISKYVKLANPEECIEDGKKYSAFVYFFRSVFLSKKNKYKKLCNIDKARFYIEEEKRIQAELRFEEKGNSLLFVLLGILITVLLAVLLTACIPYLLELLDDAVGMYKDL